MKKLFALLLALVMVLALMGCGQTAAPAKEEPKSDAPAASENAETPAAEPAAEPEISGSRLEAFSLKYHTTTGYTAVFRYEGNDITTVCKGDNFYMDTKTDEGNAILIKNGDGIYMLSPDEKVGVKMSELPDEMEDFSEDIEVEGDYTTGEMDVEGKSYYYEEFTDEDGTTRYCFDGDMLRYIVYNENGETTQVELVSISLDVDESLFTVPGDYTIMG